MNIKKSIHSFIKFQLIPLPAVGVILFVLGKLVQFNVFSLSFDIFSLLYDPLFLSILGIASLLYIDHFYKDKIKCNCHQGWKKNYHRFAGYVLGMVASFTSYLIPVVVLNMRVFDSISNGSLQSQNVELATFQVPFFVALTIFGIVARFISKDMFQSVDGESGTLFNAKKSIFQQTHELILEIKNLILEIKRKLN